MYIATKLLVPPLRPGLIPRARLFHLLDESWDAGQPVILLSAPPGYGKTTLLLQWIASRQLPTAWLALDEEDNAPTRFFQYIFQALKKHFPTLETLTAALNGPQEAPLQTLMVEVINQVVSSTPSVILVLDDYHLIQDAAVHALVQYFIDHQPPQIHLALVTRADPPFNLARLRAHRKMLEIRQKDLSFRTDEAEPLLQQGTDWPLDAGQVQDLTNRTEGWAVGLQLASLSLRGAEDPARFIQDFSGSHRYVIDYLADEVLSSLPDDLRVFLYRSSVLDRFTPALLDAALEMTNSREMLNRIESANLFLVPLDEQRNWFRYHHLMAEILRAELAPDECSQIQKRAAAWLSTHEQPVEAVQYAFNAGDHALACSMIRQAAIPAAENGLLNTVVHWLSQIPEAVLLADVELSILRAWFLIYNGRFREAGLWMQKLADPGLNLMQQLAQPEMLPLAGLVKALQAWMHTTYGSRMDLAQLEQSYALISNSKYQFFAPLVLLALGQAQNEANRMPEAQRSFEKGIALAEANGSEITELILCNNLAFLLNAAGERAAGMDLCREGIRRYSSADGKPGLLTGIPLLALGCLLYESGQIQEAYNALTQSLNLVRRLGLYEVLAAPANQTLQFLLLDQGQPQAAFALNQEVRRQAEKVGLQVVADNMAHIAAWMHLFQGDIQPVLQWAKEHPLAEDARENVHQTNIVLLHARALAEAGQAAQALDLLEPLRALSLNAGRKLNGLRVQLNQAVILAKAGRQPEAEQTLQAVAAEASRLDYPQIFYQERIALAPLLERFKPEAWPVLQALAQPEAIPSAPPPALVDPPSTRELEILRLVAAGMSNAEIADRLYITVGTTKWHLNHLFARLGVSRRTEAVARAKALGLV
jgi:LuxR family maltose regulon positive regulatory protein